MPGNYDDHGASGPSLTPLRTLGGGSAPSGLSSLGSATPRASPLNSPFRGGMKSSISRKKPLGLDISRSIPANNPVRTTSAIITAGPDSAGGERDSGGVSWIPEADRLRDEIARLQLSSKSSSSSYASGPESPSTVSPVHSSHNESTTSSTTLSARPAMRRADSGPTPTLAHSSSHHGSSRKKSSNGKRKTNDDNDLVKDEDLEVLSDLGAGNGGTVTKVWNKKRKCVMAKKLILVDAKPKVRKQIVRELQIMNGCNSPYIVSYYGCFPVDVHVGVVMEYMDIGSLDYIYRHTGAIPIDIVCKVAEAVLRGCIYLYQEHRIIHRDIKPSNVLANSRGQIKICDFGVSGELVNSIANTFVGTSTYMSPERIQGAPYSIKSDVWSLGISLVELAQGRFPFSNSDESGDELEVDDHTLDPNATLPLSTQRPHISTSSSTRPKPAESAGSSNTMSMSILDLLQHIVNEPAPRLVPRHDQVFPASADKFVQACLEKDPSMRSLPQELLQFEWIRNANVTDEQLRAWAQGVVKKLSDQDMTK